MNRNIKSKIVKKPKEKVEWDSTISDLSSFKASAEDVLERKLCHQSKNQTLHFNSQNVEKDQKESVYDRLTKRRYSNKLKTNEVNQRKDILKDMFIPDRELFELFSQSERALSNVENMFGDSKKRYKVTPTVTLAPDVQFFAKNSVQSNSSALNDCSDDDDDCSSKIDEKSSEREDDLTKFRKFIEKEKKQNNSLQNQLDQKRAVLIESIKKLDIGTETETVDGTRSGILEYICSRLEKQDCTQSDIGDYDRDVSDRIIDHFQRIDEQRQLELSSLRSEVNGSKELIDALTLELINNGQQMKRMKTETEDFMKTVMAELSQMKSYVIKYFDQRETPKISVPSDKNKHEPSKSSLADQLFKENFNFEAVVNKQQKDSLSIAEQFHQLQIDQEQTQRRLEKLLQVQKSLSQMPGDFD